MKIFAAPLIVLLFAVNFKAGNPSLVGDLSGLFAAQAGSNSAFALSSPGFPAGGEIPKQFTCDGENVSPQLIWTQPPTGTQALALVTDDPDAPAGTWTHWVIFDLPSASRGLPENTPKVEDLSGGGSQGENSFHKLGYDGPCPPPGKTHRYFFKLYALNRKLGLRPGVTKPELDQAMKNHILGHVEWMGTYHR